MNTAPALPRSSTPTGCDLAHQFPFWDAYVDLPEEVKRRARTAYQLFEENPRHPGLRFKKVHTDAPIYSVRITRDYRALGVRDSEAIVWFWIGSHADYERLLTQL